MPPERSRCAPVAKKRIHVNQHVIRANIRDDDVSPPITVKHRKNNYYVSRVEVLGPSVLIYSPKKPLLSCGARLILECSCPVLVDGKEIE